MIKSIHIKNFKSVVDLSFELGSFNVLIGENGCGKSNILEAIAFGAAASNDKLDYEYFGNRGIRATNPEFMYSAFSNGERKKSISIHVHTDERVYRYEMISDRVNPKNWINKSKETALKEIDIYFKTILEKDPDKRKKNLEALPEKDQISLLAEFLDPYKDKNDLKDFFGNLYSTILKKALSSPEISDYILYSPEQSYLRRTETIAPIYPIGNKGEGLFQYIRELALDKKYKKTLNEIKNSLTVLDWYEDFDLPDNLLKSDFTINIKDRYLYKDLKYFDQRSTNEGFLFLLFYSTLFISKTAPTFFAIDNIDASLNPKLCIQLIKNLTALAKKHKKQVLVTTQNPAILDGLNLKDDSQRLFVVRRNEEGHTMANRVEYKSERKKKLSEVWTSGYIGGLPENF